MPIAPSGKVLVTGASGYIGAWIVKYLVQHDYSVLVAVRSQKQIDFIVNRFPEYKGKVTGILVPVIEAPGAYDEAVKDVDAIIHAASPVQFSWEDPSEVIDPAVKGVTGILKSAHQFGKNVKRVVITSSALAIMGDHTPREYDETSWNIHSPSVVERDGKGSHPAVVYAASKALAERAAWDFYEANKPAYDLTAALPVYNFGPYLHDVTKEKGIGSSAGIFLSTFPDGNTTGDLVGDWVDVRDAAEQHVLALSSPAAGGERIIATAGIYAWQDLYDVLHDAGFKNIPGKATYGAGKNKAQSPVCLGDKSLRIYPGFKYRTLSESIVDMAKDFVRDGLLSA